MGYNRTYLLTKIIEIQNITIKHTDGGVKQEWLYHNVIEPRYHISRSTYYNYLQINAKAELKKLKQLQNENLKKVANNANHQHS